MALYDDFDFVDYALTVPVASKENTPGNTQDHNKLLQQKEIEELKSKLEKAEKQNAILRKNISCLFKTARAEIQRKDTTIQSQRTRISKLETVLQHMETSSAR